MSAEELARLVLVMRNLQNRYFRERSSALLSQARDAERRVDQAVAEVLNKQPKLFE